MSKGSVNFNEQAVEWYTPKSTVDRFGEFDYDPATTKEQAEQLEIPNFDTVETDGLKADWTVYKRIWINPPFNIKHLFWRKACETFVKAKNDIFFLCPIEFLTTRRFHETVEHCGIAVKLYVPDGRIKFMTAEKGIAKAPAFGSVIVKPSTTNELERMKLSEEKQSVREKGCEMNAYEELRHAAETAVADLKTGVSDTGFIVHYLQRALKKPRRNCDVGTAEVQSKRFQGQCNLHYNGFGNCFGCPCLKMSGMCEFHWAQMPYKEGETK